jgi:hypothetical protein
MSCHAMAATADVCKVRTLVLVDREPLTRVWLACLLWHRVGTLAMDVCVYSGARIETCNRGTNYSLASGLLARVLRVCTLVLAYREPLTGVLFGWLACSYIRRYVG